MISTAAHVVLVLVFCYFALGIAAFCEHIRWNPLADPRRDIPMIYTWGKDFINMTKGRK